MQFLINELITLPIFNFLLLKYLFSNLETLILPRSFEFIKSLVLEPLVKHTRSNVILFRTLSNLKFVEVYGTKDSFSSLKGL